jgi:tryptophan halogenase
MKVAVLGGGTAGFVAAVHISRTVPDAELFHIHASGIPKIGVGEGTTPRFPSWLKQTTGCTAAEVMQQCRGSIKKGTVFDGWGRDGTAFYNRFHPTYLEGCHFSADLITEFLADHVRGTYIDAVITGLESGEDGAAVLLEGGTRVACDFILDARGYPRAAVDRNASPDPDLLHLDWIPTNRAMLRPLQGGLLSGMTRAAARPHGYIFQIPLQGRTSCGYAFNGDITTDAEIEADFDAFLAEEGVPPTKSVKALTFPNFLLQTQFDGRVFRLGNASSFLEPLEGTAIGTTIFQVGAAKRLMEDAAPGAPVAPVEVAVYNGVMRNYVLRNSLFIAWHYTCGSRWDTPFWRHAARAIERARRNPLAAPHVAAMEEFINSAESVPGRYVSDYTDVEGWTRDVLPLMNRYTPYGNFSQLNFAQVGHGIGYYGTDPAGDRLAPTGTG